MSERVPPGDDPVVWPADETRIQALAGASAEEWSLDDVLPS